MCSFAIEREIGKARAFYSFLLSFFCYVLLQLYSLTWVFLKFLLSFHTLVNILQCEEYNRTFCFDLWNLHL